MHVHCSLFIASLLLLLNRIDGYEYHNKEAVSDDISVFFVVSLLPTGRGKDFSIVSIVFPVLFCLALGNRTEKTKKAEVYNMGKVNQAFVTAIKNMQSARARTLAEIQRTYAREQYADDFKLSEAARMVEELRATAEGQSAQAAEAVVAKIAELDGEEQRLAEVRAMDSDYLNRLNLKMENMERLLHKQVTTDGSVVMDDLSGTMIDQMKTYFAEFRNDPIAVGIIHERLGGHGVKVAPEDNTGKRQAHLKAVQKVFNGIAKKAVAIVGAHGVSEIQDVDIVVKGEEDAFVGYSMAQNEEFSLDDNELVKSESAKHPEQKIGYEDILWRIQMAERHDPRLPEVQYIPGKNDSGLPNY